MLILFKTSIKTILLLVLLMGGELNLFANWPDYYQATCKSIPEPDFLHPEDTIKTATDTSAVETIQKPELNIPEKLIGEAINFQVNSDISYLNIRHFIKKESKLFFIQAWQKENEVRKFSVLADSLRKAYLNSSDEQKQEISAIILKAEQQTIALNEEIPALYGKARDAESRYWQMASPEEIVRFQEKIRLYRDSIRQTLDLKHETATLNRKFPDTITFYQAEQNAVPKELPQAGIVYKIQVGAFKAKIPDSAAKSIKKLSVLRKVENYTDEKGVKIYTTGNLKNYQEALTLQSQVKQEGIKNASIAAYQNGKRIAVNEARKLNNEMTIP